MSHVIICLHHHLHLTKLLPLMILHALKLDCHDLTIVPCVVGDCLSAAVASVCHQIFFCVVAAFRVVLLTWLPKVPSPCISFSLAPALNPYPPFPLAPPPPPPPLLPILSCCVVYHAGIYHMQQQQHHQQLLKVC